MSLASKTATFVTGGIEDDNRKIEEFGVNGASADAIPLYLRWIRQDVIGLYYMVGRLATYARLTVGLLVLIAIPLWIIALRGH